MTELEEHKLAILKSISKIERNITTRLTRLESKLVRGFEEQGITTSIPENWISVDHEAGIIYLDTLGHSLMAIYKELDYLQASSPNQTFDMVHNNRVIGTLSLLDTD